MRRILFVANGHGEDAIACRIAREAAAAADGPVGLDLLSLVGDGAADPAIARVGPRRRMPSGGLVAMGNVAALRGDLAAGLAGLTLRQAAFLRGARGRYDAVAAVGDAYALALAFLAGGPTVFVGTAKSVHVAPYGPFERRLVRGAVLAFVRDAATAAALGARGTRAEAANVIADLAPEAGDAPPGRWIGLLPGSREPAYGDAVRLGRALRALGRLRPGAAGLLSVAPGIDAARLAAALGADGWTVRAGAGARPFEAAAPDARLVAWRGPLGALLAASDLVLGQAGTANEQAAAAGVPVAALGEPATDRDGWYRMRQRRLLGGALRLVPAEPEAAGAALAALLADPAALAAMAAAGRERMGPPGAARRIAAALLELAG